MRSVVYVGTIGAVSLFVAMTVPLVHGQLPVARSGTNTETVKPRQPGGLLGDQLGKYLTIEGVEFEGAKLETGTFLVDTVDGKKLDKPISLVIRGASVVNHTFPVHLRRAVVPQCRLRLVVKRMQTKSFTSLRAWGCPLKARWDWRFENC